ncbi:VanZ family protein [Nocardia uniformis]|uniref:VanZ family protein n=2 Tax=Nocardia uniformis TaxID=53432 RepID=A0A849CHG9_9NOCA|nr:VanZ family protein [Nocardia uniformis]
MVGAWALFGLRVRRGYSRAVALRFTVAEAGMLIGTLPWVWMILTPIDGERTLLLVPLRDLVETLSDTPWRAIVQVVPNMIVFAPLGFFLPLRFPWFAGVWRMVAVGAALSAALEAAQYVLDLGRFSSVDDVLMNAAGAGIGALIAKLYLSSSRRRFGRDPRPGQRWIPAKSTPE